MFSKGVQDFISGLIHAGHEAPSDMFKKQALGLLGNLIPFDAALWLSGRTTDDDVVIHNFYVQGLPRELMESWEQIKGQDRLLAHVLANPFITCDAKELYGKKERRKSEVYQQHSGKFGIEAVICTALPDPKSGLIEGISLYRSQAEPGFSEDERVTKQGLSPLLVQVWHHNQLQQLKHSSCGTDEGIFAICDPQGWMRHIEDRFIEFIRQEFKGWQPPELPQPVIAWLAESSRSRYEGRGFTLHCWDQSDLILLQLQPKGALDMLTPREKEVAKLYGAGLTYKEIAADLFLAPATVRHHLESIYRKLDICSKVELIQSLGR